MSQQVLSRPGESEYAPFYAGYIARIDGDAIERLKRQATAFEPLRNLAESRADSRYEPDKWSVKEVIGHVTDAERVFAYRLLRIARGDATPLPGFEQAGYVANAGFGRHSMGTMLDAFRATRASTLAMLGEFDDAAWTRMGVASGFPVSARAIAYIIAGHLSHHASLLREKYGLALTED